MSTENTDRIEGLLRTLQVSTPTELGSRLGLSRPTVFRALAGLGYFRSVNYGGQFVTLTDTPVFDSNGLWAWGEVRFSQYGTLENTIAELVTRADAGLTVQELQARVGTRVHNQVSKLRRQGRLRSTRLQHVALYTCTARDRSLQQRSARMRSVRSADAGAPDTAANTVLLPEGMSATEVIALLVIMIESPEATAADLARALRKRGFSSSAEKVRCVVRFYGLEKKGAQWR